MGGWCQNMLCLNTLLMRNMSLTSPCQNTVILNTKHNIIYARVVLYIVCDIFVKENVFEKIPLYIYAVYEILRLNNI